MVWSGGKVTNENVDKVKQLMGKLYQTRKEKLAKTLPQHQNEIESLPQILKVRMNALKEVNPEKFSDSPELVLSTLAASDLIKQYPSGANQLKRTVVEDVCEKYHLVCYEDVYPELISDMFFAYYKDIENEAITQDGKIKDIEKSKVMRVFHNFEKHGLPIDAKKNYR